MIHVYFAGHPKSWPTYQPLLAEGLSAAGLQATVSNEAPDPAAVDFIVYSPDGPLQDFGPFTKAQAVLSLWAGVERVVSNPTLTQPLCRMVDPGLTHGMTEWVVGNVLRYHLGLDAHVTVQDGSWRDHLVPPLAADRCVGILGMGALGAASGRALATLGFEVLGWSRRRKRIARIASYSGDKGLATVLSRAEILVLLLPQTPQTTGIINAATLMRMPKGAMLLNPGRGPLVDDAALLGALDRGHIAHATLDVFAKEPLPKVHPYWAHPKVTVTPHVASVTRAPSAVQAIVQNIARAVAGEPLLNQVNPKTGY